MPRSLKVLLVEDITQFDTSMVLSWGSTTEIKIFRLQKVLEKFGLEEYEVELIMDKFVAELTLHEIVKIQGWTSTGSCNYSLKQALTKLKERGFKL